MSKVSSYVKETIARLTGDDNKVIAAKNERLSKAAIKGQLAAKEGRLVQLEVEVENADDALLAARRPETIITNPGGYVAAIFRALDNLADAKEAVKDEKKSISILEDELVANAKMVDSE